MYVKGIGHARDIVSTELAAQIASTEQILGIIWSKHMYISKPFLCALGPCYTNLASRSAAWAPESLH